MDEHEASKPSDAPAASSGDAAETSATPASPEAQSGDPGTALANVESPTIVPAVDAARRASEDADKADGRGRWPFDEISAGEDGARRAARGIVLVPETEAKRAAPRREGLKLLVASIAIAAAVGAIAGGLVGFGIAHWSAPAGDSTAAADELQSLHGAVAQLRTEVAGLKNGADAAARSTSQQLTKLSERIEHAQAEVAKPTKTSDSLEHRPESVAVKETTGSVTPQVATTTPALPTQVPPTGVVPGWVLRDVYHGAAILQGRFGAMVEVEPGDVLPGIGRVESIRRLDGRWVVMTSRGMITSMR
jgi:hypothetical protein